MNKKLMNPVLAIVLCAAVFTSCKNDKPLTSETQEVTTTQHGDTYLVDVVESKIEWKGYKVFKSENTSHFGTIKFQSGELTVKDNKLESGKFVADVTSLENVDLKDDAEQKAKLEGHLKSGDFFEVEKYPTATYEITKVSDATGNADYNTVLEGNLTMKGITKPIKFNANVSVADGVVTVATEPTDIKREDFGVKFQIPVANGMIKNDVNVQVLIKAKTK
ncbi:MULTISPECIES: YceI family protein [Amniculibacterium]|uniref:YceI family protein n=1 Tax=Amniculibacterium TaxID=2715289 RepID=UPI000F5A481C|nr:MULTISPECIES: YceI family protein [Amniculibacterium]